jgi:hypothetical protein
MKEATKNDLIELLKKDQLIRNKNFTHENINEDFLIVTRLKIQKRFKTIRWILAITLILIALTFFYLAWMDKDISRLGYFLIRSWFINLPMITVIILFARELWNSRRNLLIVDLFEKEIIENSKTK